MKWAFALASFALLAILLLSKPPLDTVRPTEIKVGPFLFHVEENTVISNEYLGLTSCDMSTIYLAPNMPIDKQREVLWHELQHTAYCTPGILKQSRDVDLAPWYSEEEAVFIMAPHMVMILRDNPELVRWLTE